MSKGKYSPTVFHRTDFSERLFIYNAKGQIGPDPWDVYDEETCFTNYDSEGYDVYGYSAYDKQGNFVGVAGNGVDRNGLTEWDYLTMSDEEFEKFC